jgi:tetratricopeptide (TPR) repeat protein
MSRLGAGRPTPLGGLPPLHLLALCALVLGTALFKIDASRRALAISPEDDTALFWSESSFHYRYARAIARGEPLPPVDRDPEWPAGVEPLREFTMGMEFASGLSYRALAPLLGGVPFHVYLVSFIAIWSSLSVVAAYAAGRAIWPEAPAGLVAAFAYALSPISIHRTVGNFLREDFALPLLFGAFALFAAAMRAADGASRDDCDSGVAPPVPAAGVPRAEAMILAASALLLGLGTATWHLSRFYLTAFLVLLAPALALCARGSELRGAARLGAAARFLRAAVAALAASGLIVPVLRAKRFLLSPAFLIAIALWAVVELARRRARRGMPLHDVVFAAALAVAAVAAMLAARALPGAEGEYAHVNALLVEKLRFLGRKPEDPSLLTEDARVFWSGPFESSSAGLLLLTLSSMMLWGTASIALAARDALHRRLDPTQLHALLLALFFAAAALLVQRLLVFLVFFAAVVAPRLCVARGPGGSRYAAPPTRRARGPTLAVVLLCVLALYEIAHLRAFEAQNPWRRWVEAHFPLPVEDPIPNGGNNRRLVAWVRRHTPEDAVFLTWFPTGPLLLTDAGRRINLHSMFESSALRAKEARMRAALYGSEEELAALCREWDTDYFVYQANLLLNTTKVSYRYMADRMRVASDCAAVRMHFHPERLRHFQLVYQDAYFRLFHVRSGDAEADAAAAPQALLPYEEIFDPAGVEPMGEVYPDERTQRLLAAVSRRAAEVERAFAAEAAGDARGAEAIYRAILANSPDVVEARLRLALLALSEGRVDAADSVIARALETRPDFAEFHYARGLVLEARGRREDAAAAYEEALAIAPSARPARDRLRALGAAGRATAGRG